MRDCPVGVTVDVSSNNFSLARKLNVDPRLGELEIRVKAKADVHIKGRLVDASGQPVGKAMVISLPRRAARFPNHESDARTGQFDVGPIPPGWYRLLVMARGFAWYYSTDRQLTAGETWDVGAVRLHRGGRLAVRIGSAAVSSQAKSKIRMAVINSGFRSLVRLRIGADLVRSKLLAPGRYLLSVTGPDVAAQAIPFVITDGEDRELDVTLTEGWQCKFSVQAPPSVGEYEMVRLTIEGAGGVVEDRMVPRRKAPAFVFECGLATGHYTVTVRAESGSRSKTDIVVSGKKKLQFELSLR